MLAVYFAFAVTVVGLDYRTHVQPLVFHVFKIEIFAHYGGGQQLAERYNLVVVIVVVERGVDDTVVDLFEKHVQFGYYAVGLVAKQLLRYLGVVVG